MKLTEFLLAFGLTLMITTCYSQEYVELGQLGYRHSFKTSSMEGGEEGKSISGARINVMLPLKLSDNTYFIPGFRFWQYDMQPGENLKWYLFQVGIQTKFNEKLTWQFFPLLRSGIYQDASFGDGFQYGLLTILRNKIKDNLTLGYGFYTNKELFGPVLTPVLAIDWNISDRLTLFGNFPINVTVSYSLNERWNTGILYAGLVTSFMGDGEYIERQSLDFSGFIEYYITKNIVAQATLGYPTDRSYDTYAADDKVDFSLSLIRFGDDRVVLDSFTDSNFMVSFSLYYRMPK